MNDQRDDDQIQLNNIFEPRSISKVLFAFLAED
jgi:hypothetical protein